MKVKRTTAATPRGQQQKKRKAQALVAAASVQQTTLYELVETVSEYARNDAEVLATVTHLVNSGQVRLVGRLRNARIALRGGGRSVA